MAKRKFYGFLDDMSPEQEAFLNETKQWISDGNVLDMEALMFDDHDILRFCRARKFERDKVRLMLQNFAVWHRDQNIGTLLETWEFPEMPALKRALPHGLHKVDNEGRPIFIRRVGMIDFEAFFAWAPAERMVRQITYQCEEYKYLIYPALSKIYNRHIESNVQIFDLTDGSVRKMMSRQCLNLLKMSA